MIYNTNGNLSGLQTLHRTLYKPPENSLVAFGYDRIHHFVTYKSLTYHVDYSSRMNRLYALAIPLFALLDTLQFAGKSIYQFITLNWESALYNICNCAKSLKVFLVTFIMYIPNIIAPARFLKDERFWIDIQQKATIKKVEQSEGFKTVQDGAQQLELTLKGQVNEFVLEEPTRALCNECIKEMINSLPKDLNKVKIVASTYVSITAEFLVTAANKNITFDYKEEFLALFKELVQIQDPEFKENFLTLMLAHHSSLKELTKERTSHSLILTFLLRLLTDSEQHIIQASELLNHNYFTDDLHRRTFFKTLLLLHDTRLTKEQNNHVLEHLALLFPTVPQTTTAPRAKFKNRKSKITKKLEENRIKAEQIRVRLQTLSPGDASLKDKAYQHYQNTSKQLIDLEKAIRTAENTIETGENADRVITEFPAADVSRGFQNLTIILYLPTKEMIETIIDSLGQRYKSLNDAEILKDLFIQVFSFAEISPQNLNALWDLRAPEVLLKFHLRLMEYTEADKTAVLERNKEVVLSILNGTFWQTRFKTENNPHLSQVFDNRLDLMHKWTDENPKKCKVQDLIPNASNAFKDCEVTLSKDPSDILLIGTDLRHCLNLNGRLTRVPGLLAFLADGKTHMIVAKASDKGPSLAQTLIMLLWDPTKNQPVLFLERTYSKGKERGDYTLGNASIAYAKQMALDLGIELVVSVYNNNDPEILVVGEQYKRSVVSLKTSSPIEYVYSFNRIVKPPYTLGHCYTVPKRHSLN